MLQTEIRPLLQSLARSLATRLGNSDVQLGGLFTTAADAIIAQARQSADRTETVEFANEASIHLSWVSQISATHTAHRNLIVHELAHVLDFENGGIDGAASPHARAAGPADDLTSTPMRSRIGPSSSRSAASTTSAPRAL